MPHIEEMDLLQTAVLWEASGHDDNGEVVLNNPFEIPCRWEESRKQTINAQGDVVMLDATVVVKLPVPIHSVIWLGTIATFVEGVEDVKQVVTVSKVPDIRNRVFRRVLGLNRYGGTLPLIGTGS